MPPKILGILNITPDSFSDGGQFFHEKKAVARAEKMFREGAWAVDIGGESTRPGASEISSDEEWSRVKNVIKVLIEKFGGKKISLDTRKFIVAERFLVAGGQILNDVSGFRDPKMIELATKFTPLVIVNHFPGKTIAEVHEQKISSKNQVADELLARKAKLIRSGISAKKIVLDPGIGFGKTMKLNRELLKFAEFLPRERVLIGYSRKRFLGENRFETATNLIAARTAVAAGAEFLRVHEVMATVSEFAEKTQK